jgi:hypothetical protein
MHVYVSVCFVLYVVMEAYMVIKNGSRLHSVHLHLPLDVYILLVPCGLCSVRRNTHLSNRERAVA